MIYIFKIFRHVVSGLTFGLQISRDMLVVFLLPGYLRYLGASRAFYHIWQDALHVPGVANWIEGKCRDTWSEGRRSLGKYFQQLDFSWLCPISLTFPPQRGIFRNFTPDLEPVAPHERGHDSCTRYFTTLQPVFHIPPGSLETSLSIWLEFQGQGSLRSPWLFCSPLEEINKGSRTFNFIFLDIKYFRRNLLLLLLRF